MVRVMRSNPIPHDGAERHLAFEQLVLLAILRVGEGAYGVSVQGEIERVTSRDVTPGALYRALDRLEERGLVASGTGEPRMASASYGSAVSRSRAKSAVEIAIATSSRMTSTSWN